MHKRGRYVVLDSINLTKYQIFLNLKQVDEL